MTELPVSRQERREKSDPYELQTPIPLVMRMLTAAMVVFGIVYILNAGLDGRPELGDGRTLEDLAAKASDAPKSAAADGAALFAARCAACHQASGQGVPGVFPPLAGSEWVKGDATRLAKIVLHGVQGPITVRGASYDGAMPAFKEQLDDGALAAVASYVRAQWGNDAPPVTKETIATARAATASRDAPWNGEAELAAMK